MPPHNKVTQAMILKNLKDHGVATVWDLSFGFQVSEATIRRRIDGLMVQGKIRQLPATGRARVYDLVRD